MVQEDQALRLISELEENRLGKFQEEIQNLECQLQSLEVTQDPTDAIRQFIKTGARRDALQAVFSQPYLQGASDRLKAWIAEGLEGLDDAAGRQMMKALPLKRSARRGLLRSYRWAIHLGSHPTRASDPISLWSDSKGMQLLQVDIQAKGGKGWDMTRRNSVWRVLLWAAATGRIALILSSPPRPSSEGKQMMQYQDMFLWSVASIARNSGIPYVCEPPVPEGSLGGGYVRWTPLMTNLDMALMGEPVGVTTDQLRELDEEERLNRMFEQESVVSSSDESPVLDEVDQDKLPGNQPGEEEIELGDYEPSFPGEEDDFLSRFDISVEEPRLDDGRPYRTGADAEAPNIEVVQAEALGGLEVKPAPIWEDEAIPQTKEELEKYLEEIATPPDQVVLRYFIALKSKSGSDVTTGIQQMIMEINKMFPVCVLHSDPGTEFTSDALKKWLAQKFIRQQHPSCQRHYHFHHLEIHLPKQYRLRAASPQPEDPESVSREALLDDDFSDESFRRLMRVLQVPGHDPSPDPKPLEVEVMNNRVIEFDARLPHAVKRQPDWFVVGFTPLGTSKLQKECHDELRRLGLGFRYTVTNQTDPAVRAVRPDCDQEQGADMEGSPQEDAPATPCDLNQDIQQDSFTPIIGWDFSGGNPGDFPVANLEETDLHQFLVERGVPWLYRRLRFMGVEEAVDLQFLFEEDLLEFGIPQSE
ncbi:GIP, partial [Symbiodinium sp. CCMP2456]